MSAANQSHPTFSILLHADHLPGPMMVIVVVMAMVVIVAIVALPHDQIPLPRAPPAVVDILESPPVGAALEAQGLALRFQRADLAPDLAVALPARDDYCEVLVAVMVVGR